MKTKIIYLAIFAAFWSCSDFLEVDSETELSDNAFFETPEDFEKAINGAYAPLRDAYDKSAYVMGEMRSDNSYYDYNADNRGQNPPEFIADFVEQSSNENIQAKWDYNYFVISRANKILNEIDNVDFSEANVKDNITGQAHFLRALAYFDLVQFFGGVPLHLDPVTTLEGTALPITAPSSIYDQIIDDAQQAIATLPKKADQEPGRATLGAAKTLLGNVYVVLEKWPEARDVLKEVVDSEEYDLMPTYADAFNPNNKNNQESVFEIQYKEGPEGYNSDFIYQFMPQPITADEVAEITGLPDGVAQGLTVEGFNLPTPDLIASYEPGDPRLDATIQYIDLSASGKLTPYVNKYNHAHAQFQNTNDNWPVYRFSEVLLLLAEAMNESNSGDPLMYLNRVRARVDLDPITTTNTDELRDIILHERRVELAFENKRWLDLVRTGNAETVMKAFGANVIANPQEYYFPEGTGPIPSAYGTINTLFPLPSRETILNPNLN
ncbi:RagB/SusD family nutrient uptake outer membrane protein [Flavobacteriaceae bacterium GSB9]|nr:RagB/SusD family nutrient uptake outer membrane protein [Flavobacteriaceae bacterium GSB9]